MLDGTYVAKYETDYPDIVAIIKDDLDATLAFYDLEAKVWRSLCSTNILERVNRELKRRFDKVRALKETKQQPRLRHW